MARDKKAGLNIVGTSPVGKAAYPHINKPDYAFKKEHGEYSVKLELDGDDAAAFKETIDKFHAVAFEAEKDSSKIISSAKAAKKLGLEVGDPNFQENTMPYSDVYDDENNVIPGRLSFKFGALGGGTRKLPNGKSAVWSRSITIVDSAKKITKAEIWGGSLLRVAYTSRVWCNGAIGFGVSLQLDGVQIIELITRRGGDADSLGFDTVEDGFVAPEGEDLTDHVNEDEETPDAEEASDPDF